MFSWDFGIPMLLVVGLIAFVGLASCRSLFSVKHQTPSIKRPRKRPFLWGFHLRLFLQQLAAVC